MEYGIRQEIFQKFSVTDTVFGEQTFCFFVGPVRFAIRHVTHDSLHRQLSIDKSPSRHAYSADAAQKVILKIKGATAAAASLHFRSFHPTNHNSPTLLRSRTIRTLSTVVRICCFPCNHLIEYNRKNIHTSYCIFIYNKKVNHKPIMARRGSSMFAPAAGAPINLGADFDDDYDSEEEEKIAAAAAAQPKLPPVNNPGAPGGRPMVGGFAAAAYEAAKAHHYAQQQAKAKAAAAAAAAAGGQK